MNTLSVLKKMDEETKANVFITGGFVRDYLRNKKNDDLDVVIKGMPLKEIGNWLRRHGKLKRVRLAKTNDLFNVSILLFRANGDSMYAQISLPKRGPKQVAHSRNTLQQDVQHRDFTINALYLPASFRSKKDVIDLVGGREHIKQRMIVAVGSPHDRLIESPIRIMRAISLAARTNYAVDNALTEAIHEHLDLLYRVPMENIRAELDKIILSKRPSRYFKLMEKLGILKIVLPELYGCVGVQQNEKYHKFDVFKHSIYAMDNIEPILELRLAALLHDIGKSVTRKEHSDGRVTFYKHEVFSAKMATNLLTRLGYPTRVRKTVIKLIRNHMFHYTRDWTDLAVRKFIRKVGINDKNIDNLDEFPLFKLRAAERLGNGLKKEAVTDRQRDFQKRIVEVYNAGNALSTKDLKVNGHDIMNMFNLSPSQKVGDILNFLLKRVMENPKLNEKSLLLKEAVDYLSKGEKR
ncbi:MAG: hypothetical protein DRO87_09890 [Candidatus Thorarchaeota archaeon]|nr:MAG: hypothetical protein DRO87_09890 [Candidatus Thorarchaeota archaeon]